MKFHFNYIKLSCTWNPCTNKRCHHRMTYAPNKHFDKNYEHFSKPKGIFRNLNADPKFKVKGIKICMRMERPCPYTNAYKTWMLYLKEHRSYEHFLKPKRKVRQTDGRTDSAITKEGGHKNNLQRLLNCSGFINVH